jgi:hypothetical protein
MKLCVLLLLAAPLAQANAIGKIVGMLKEMKATVEKEGAAEVKEFEEYAELMRSKIQETGYNIKDAKEDKEAAAAKVADADGKVTALSDEISTLAALISDKTAALEESTKVRKEENTDFLAAQQELTDGIDTIIRAAQIIKKATNNAGSAGSSAKLKAALMQVAGTLQVVIRAAYVNAETRSQLQAFLQSAQQGDDEGDDSAASGGYVQPTAAAYTAQSGGIVDMLTDLKQETETELQGLRKDEMEKQHAYDMEKQSLEDAIRTAERDLSEAKGDLAEQQEISATQNGVQKEEATKQADNEKLLEELTQEQAASQQEHENRVKDRTAEVEALSKAIEILSAGDVKEATDRRDVFFLQQVPDVRSEISEILQKASHRFHSVAFAQLALSAKNDPFGKVKGLIKDMIKTLQEQAAAEATHKAFCDKENKKATAKRDDQTAKLEKYSTRLEKAMSDQEALKQGIAEIAATQVEMDQTQAAAKKLRTEQSEAFALLMSDCTTGLTAIAKAIEVLKEYYSQKRSHEAKGDSATNVIAFLEVAQEDMIKMKNDGQEAESQAQAQSEKDSNEYEVQTAANKAATQGKEAELTRLGAAIEDLKNNVDDTQKELDAVLNYLEELKGQCVHKVMSFEDRAAKMQKEIDSLKEALEILENETADSESFLQRKHY